MEVIYEKKGGIAHGRVRNTIQEAVDDVWGGVRLRIDLDGSGFTPESLACLDEFSTPRSFFRSIELKVADRNFFHAESNLPRNSTSY